MATQSSGAGVGSETLCETEKADKDETATLKIKLKKKEKETKKIQWTEDTVDNEGKNKQIYTSRFLMLVDRSIYLNGLKHLFAGLQIYWRTDWTEDSDHRVSSISEFG